MIEKKLQSLSSAEQVEQKHNFISSLEKKIKVELDYFDNFDYHPLLTKEAAVTAKHSRDSDAITTDDPVTMVEFHCGDDDMSTKSELTMDPSVHNHKKTISSGTSEDITREMQTFSKTMEGDGDASWQWHSNEFVDEDSSADVVIRRYTTSNINALSNKRMSPCNRNIGTTNAVATSLSTPKARGYTKKSIHVGINASPQESGLDNKESDTNSEQNDKIRTKRHLAIGEYAHDVETSISNSPVATSKKITMSKKTTRRTHRVSAGETSTSRNVQWSNEVRNRQSSGTKVNVTLDYVPERGMTPSELATRSVVLGQPVINREQTLVESSWKTSFDMNVSYLDRKLLAEIDSLMNDAIAIFRGLLPNDVNVADMDEVCNRFVVKHKAFSIIAPCKERTSLKVSHGSHRFKYRAFKDDTTQIIH